MTLRSWNRIRDGQKQRLASTVNQTEAKSHPTKAHPPFASMQMTLRSDQPIHSIIYLGLNLVSRPIALLLNRMKINPCILSYAPLEIFETFVPAAKVIIRYLNLNLRLLPS